MREKREAQEDIGKPPSVTEIKAPGSVNTIRRHSVCILFPRSITSIFGIPTSCSLSVVLIEHKNLCQFQTLASFLFGTLTMRSRQDSRRWVNVGPEHGVQRYLESEIWAIANMECENKQHEGIRYHCMLLQQMTKTAAIL
jgi:hypothetical protein